MNQFIPTLTTGVAAFVATNIDDILILSLFFSQVSHVLKRKHIVLGQYLGFAALIIASLPGFLGSYFVPPEWIKLLGFVPVIVGLSMLLKPEEEDDDEAVELEATQTSPFLSFLSPQTYSVAAITVANGSDNISIYVPLFANSQIDSLLVILGTFFTLVGVWCYTAYQLTRWSGIAKVLMGYGNSLVPCVLISLGVFIVKENIPLTLLTLGASCLYLVGMDKFNSNSIPKIEDN